MKGVDMDKSVKKQTEEEVKQVREENTIRVNQQQPPKELKVNEYQPKEDTTVDELQPKNPPNPPAQVGPPRDDPDFGHFDEDKFKIQDGDIIEYLMKDVILDCSASIMNKVAGIAAIPVYEGGTYVLKKVGQGAAWTGSKIGDALYYPIDAFKKWKNRRRQQQATANNGNTNGNNGNAFAAGNENQSSPSLDTFLDSSSAYSKFLQNKLDLDTSILEGKRQLDDSSKTLLTSLYNNRYIFDDNKKQVIDPNGKSISYEEFADRCRLDVDRAKEHSQKGEKRILSQMKEQLGIKDDSQDADLKQYCRENLQYSTEKPMTSKHPEWKGVFESVREKNKQYSENEMLNNVLKVTIINTKVEMIAHKYALYKTMEYLRSEKVPNLDEIPDNVSNQMDKIRAKTFAETKGMLWNEVKNLDLDKLNGITEKMSEQSIKATKNNEDVKIKDEFEKTIKNNEDRTIVDAAKDNNNVNKLLEKRKNVNEKMRELLEKRGEKKTPKEKTNTSPYYKMVKNGKKKVSR